MAQITLYIDDDMQARLRATASRRGVSQSQFVAELIRRATADAWPDEVLALAGSVRDFPLSDEGRGSTPDDIRRVDL